MKPFASSLLSGVIVGTKFGDASILRGIEDLVVVVGIVEILRPVDLVFGHLG